MSDTSSPSLADAGAALTLLRNWARDASAEDVAKLDPAIARLLPEGAVSNYPPLSRDYPEGFEVTPAYHASLPDLQNGPASLIKGSDRQIQHVGIAGFRLPVNFRRLEGGTERLEARITGTVSLDANKKGINMSRIMRSFYKYAESTFSLEVLGSALDAYKADLDSFDARIQMQFSYPMRVDSLRSGLSGFQFYDIALELVETAGRRKRLMHLDYVYSSTCPCSLELSEHARMQRGQLATPHSQRSVARISVEMIGPDVLWFEDLIALCRRAVPTETQVMVKREDEQAFAELNAANPIFVEDAARLFAEQLEAEPRVGDFRIVASHQESLHSHDAVSVLSEGTTFAHETLEPHLFATLVPRG